ncbi:GNAT family N-acetyltransferase [Glaciibacter psychrotolerans]|uniref:Ribosomal protein S18 acetylase RimI-like enzyme n=1 Tax=Glaciibacter psychrotolerans TaxID=670054 RepID=A0A7Z0EGF0_9MICO|nr:GNAT family N-acetyltransferase [Leifsonia psychrotolerans]NYJ21189.1 ribosomal protein S18 acetylase RimI-like enzyme [Leifsonia psychrotolerans]
MRHAPSSVVSYRPAGPADEPFLRGLFADSRASDFAHVPGTDAAVQQIVSLQFDAQAAMLTAHHPRAVHEIILIEGRARGRVITDTTAERIHLVDIAVVADHQGQGIGSQVVSEICQRAASSGRTVELSVWGQNDRAIRLYVRLGFEPGETTGHYLSMRWVAGIDTEAFA